MVSINLKNLTQTDLPKEVQPQFILDVEKSELHINAGLQDRVIQVIVFAQDIIKLYQAMVIVQTSSMQTGS